MSCEKPVYMLQITDGCCFMSCSYAKRMMYVPRAMPRLSYICTWILFSSHMMHTRLCEWTHLTLEASLGVSGDVPFDLWTERGKVLGRRWSTMIIIK